MAPSLEWRGAFTNHELNALHAEAFGTPVSADHEWDWSTPASRYSLGWVVAREDGQLAGFVNVLWDGLVHAWIQDTMVRADRRGHGIGSRLVAAARRGAADAGCEWLHVDFAADLAPFYIDACGFRQTTAGLIDLTET